MKTTRIERPASHSVLSDTTFFLASIHPITDEKKSVFEDRFADVLISHSKFCEGTNEVEQQIRYAERAALERHY